MIRSVQFIFAAMFFVLCLTLSAAAQTEKDTVKLQTMSLDVKDTDIKDVIRMISKGYGLNIILDREVTGKVTLHLTDAPIIEGLTTLAESNGWELAKEGRVYRIRKPVAEKKFSIRYSRGKLTVDIQNIDVIDFIKEISSKTAMSIVPDSKIKGKVSGKLYNVPLEDGLKALLEGSGFKVTKRKNIYRVSQEELTTGGIFDKAAKRRISRKAGKGVFYVECSKDYLTIDVLNGNLQDVINAISEQGEIEIIIYGRLSGEVNARLNNIPLTKGLALLLGGTKFTFVQKDNVILIGDRNTATPSGKALSKSELIHLKHIKADEVPKILPKNIPAHNVKVIKEQNALLVSGTSEDIVKIREFLETIDIPIPQVVIDVVVVEYSRDVDKDFGFEFEGNFNETEEQKTTGSNFFSFPELVVKRKGKRAKDVLKALTFKSRLIDKLPPDFNMTLRLLETQNKAKVLAQPSITVLNGHKAKIDVGQTQYFRIEGGTENNPTTNFRPIKFGITVNITPWISKSGQITAEISPEISNSMGANEEGYPNIFRRSVTTTVRIDDGKTLVLGGLLRTEEQVSYKKVPILGDIPILGYLFKSTRKKKIQTNLIIYITPRIVRKEGYVNLEEELKKFDIKERKGIFKSEFERDIESVEIEKSDVDITKPLETKGKDSKKDLQEDNRGKKNLKKKSEKEISDSTSIEKPRKKIRRRRSRKEAPDTTAVNQ